MLAEVSTLLLPIVLCGVCGIESSQIAGSYACLVHELIELDLQYILALVYKNSRDWSF